MPEKKSLDEMTPKELIDFISSPNVIDKEGVITDDRYWEARDKLLEHLNLKDKTDIEDDISELEKKFKKHDHKDGNVVVKV